MKVLQFGECIVEGGPAVWGADLQGWQLENPGAKGFQHPPSLTLLLLGTGDHHRASLQWLMLLGSHAPGVSSSFTRPLICAFSAAASSWRCCACRTAMAFRNPDRAPSISPPISRATARF